MINSIPKDITILENWGYVSIVAGQNPTFEHGVQTNVPDNVPYTEGEHIYISGASTDIHQWLSDNGGTVWIGVDSPMMQDFKLEVFKEFKEME
jgi:hypothetical protein